MVKCMGARPTFAQVVSRLEALAGPGRIQQILWPAGSDQRYQARTADGRVLEVTVLEDGGLDVQEKDAVW